jgi:hypothetical protein
MTDGGSNGREISAGSEVRERASASSTKVRARRAHPLLEAFPLAVITLATFLVVFTLMMARLTAGADPALRAGATANAVTLTAGSGVPTVRTRVSGAAAAAGGVAQTVAAHGAPTATPAIVTRTSGAPGATGVSDD